MQEQKNIIDCYNKTANNYADKFIDELSGKHLDRILLKSFALENIAKGKSLDLGCGPGQTTACLFNCGLTDITGTDISPEMISIAKKINAQIVFEVADMLSLTYPAASFGSAVAFYSIVHFDAAQVKQAFSEIHSILKKNGEFLFSFHIGDKQIHLDEFLEKEVNIDFYFFETRTIVNLLKETGFDIIDIIEREPYVNVEHHSKRAYVWVRKI